MIRVIIVTHQEQDLNRIRAAVRSRKDVAVIGTGSDSYGALRLAENRRPDIALIDCQLDYDGLEIVPLVKRRSPGTSLRVVSSCNNVLRACSALVKGASAYVLRKSDMDFLGTVICVVRAGGYYISQRVMAGVPRVMPDGERGGGEEDIPVMGRGEWRVLELVRRGKSTKEIGEALNLKPGTVRNYISGLMRKVGVHSRGERVGDGGAYGRRPGAVSGGKVLPLLEARLNLKN
jgi:two-component system response regulator DesR